MAIDSFLPTFLVRLPPMEIVSSLSTVSVRLRVNGNRLVVVDRLGPIVLDVRRLVVVDRLLPVVPHPVRLVVLDLDVLVLLGVDEQLLRALLVLEPDLVEIVRRPALASCGDFMPDCVLFAGSAYGGICSCVVDAADDDRLVGIAFEEIDDHLLPDARRGDARPSPCPPTAATRAPSTSCSRPSSPPGPSGTAPSPGRTCPCRSPRPPGRRRPPSARPRSPAAACSASGRNCTESDDAGEAIVIAGVAGLSPVSSLGWLAECVTDVNR